MDENIAIEKIDVPPLFHFIWLLPVSIILIVLELLFIDILFDSNLNENTYATGFVFIIILFALIWMVNMQRIIINQNKRMDLGFFMNNLSKYEIKKVSYDQEFNKWTIILRHKWHNIFPQSSIFIIFDADLVNNTIRLESISNLAYINKRFDPPYNTNDKLNVLFYIYNKYRNSFIL